ncbi:MAG: class I SAM-dependent methyltransferase, partial [Lachnospiraceae bacterium]|nr:class I SAM-dependent methyltransferase [Lachnospiraceae bacterium]
MELDKLYQNRFEDNKESKKDIWIEIVRYLKKFLPDQGITSVVDVAAGYCEFINNFDISGCSRYAYDLNPDVSAYAAPGVETINDSIDSLDTHFDKDSISLVFMSNFLEHITKAQIESLFDQVHSILKPGGQLWILTPNIKYVGGKYWDFWDHITPITEDSLLELAELKGYSVKKVIKRFLPYTTKSALPQGRGIVRLYLMLMPISGRF